MSDTNIESQDQQLIPKIADKYADYYDMNSETTTDVGTSEVKVEDKTEVKPVDDKQPDDSSTPEEKPVHKPAWQKRIDKQTAKIKQLEAQLAEIQNVKANQKELPKYKRENFVSDDEYEQYRDQQLEANVNKKFTETQEKQIIEAKRAAEEEAFNTTWQEKVKHNFDGDQEGYTEFAGLIRQNATAMSKWHQDIHDFMEGTDYGPRMMQVLFYRPDIIEQINTAKPIVRMKILNNLESEIATVLRQPKVAQQPAKPAVTKAPTPIGTVGSTGSVLSDDESDDVAYQRYMKKKFGGK
jgi:hypothetical protein